MKTPDFIAQLEDLSVPNNQVRLEKVLKFLGGTGLLIAGYEFQDSSLGQDLATSLATVIVSQNLNPFLELQKLFRKKIGIMPEKMVEVGTACLKMLDLDREHQIVLVKENDLDKLKSDWKRIIDSGSPIIALSRARSALAGHYVVFHGVSKNNDFYYWDIFVDMAKNFTPDEKLENELDSYKSGTFKASSLLSGIDSRFTYLYFAPVE